MKKYILFDHDGVLVETEQWYYLANERALASLGIDLPRDVYLANMANGVSAWERARDSGIAESEIGRAREQRNRYYQEYLMTEDIEIEGILETLAELSGTYRMGVVTTAKPPDFALIHEKRSILDHMEFCLTRGDYERAKPHPEPYLAGLERFGAPAAEAVVIEDSARGLKSAVGAGIDCIVVANEFTATHDFSTATARVATFRELPAAIAGLTG
ncbi:MAG: HAD-IA family hydrolase [Dehalococcoidia bacterium]|nr:HAD-IA family hydrolase [Dehalococcoidia bacterium]MYA54121.1 HAD-IA family hydrolase [Dehalococcoidia bacterium]